MNTQIAKIQIQATNPLENMTENSIQSPQKPDRLWIRPVFIGCRTFHHLPSPFLIKDPVYKCAVRRRQNLARQKAALIAANQPGESTRA